MGPVPGPVAYLPPAHPSGDRIALIIVLVVVVLVVGSIVMSALLYLFVSSTIIPPSQTPKALGIAIGRSADGTNWTLTFTSVPSGLSPATTNLQLVTPGGSLALAASPLASFGGSSVDLAAPLGSVYLQYQPLDPQVVSAGDTLLIATMTTTGTSTTGFQVTFISQTSILYVGTLQ